MNNKELLKEAYKLAVHSPDTSTQIGAFLVAYDGQVESLTNSFNRPTKGWVMTEADWERPAKYALLEHAERGVIYNAATYGICTAGGTMVASWAACADCARSIVASGIKTLVRHQCRPDGATDRWLESVSIGDKIMRAGGVEIVDVLGPIGGAPKVLRNGEFFDPSYYSGDWHNEL